MRRSDAESRQKRAHDRKRWESEKSEQTAQRKELKVAKEVISNSQSEQQEQEDDSNAALEELHDESAKAPKDFPAMIEAKSNPCDPDNKFREKFEKLLR